MAIDNTLSILDIDIPPSPHDYNVLEIICDDTTGGLNALILEKKNMPAKLYFAYLNKNQPCIFFMN